MDTPIVSAQAGHGAAAPVSLPAAAGQRLPPLLLLHQAVAIVAAVAQLTITATQWNKASNGVARAQTAALSATMSAIAWAVWRWPMGYWRNRSWMMPGARVMLYLMPSVRQVGVGASLMLERPAQPGWAGAASDFLRVLAGTRLLGVAVGGAAVLNTPAATLAMQTLSVLLTRNTDQYCSTQLMQSPLSQQRIGALASLLEFSSLPVFMMVPVAERVGPASRVAETLLKGTASPEHVCHSMLPFLSITLGICGPTALAAFCWGAEDLEAENAGDASSSDAGSTDYRSGGSTPASSPAGRRSAPAPAAPRPHAVRRAWRGGMATANRALCFLFCATPGVESRALVCWWMLALCWWLCSRLAGHAF